jgi:nucleoside-diphosphate-sugar epimerase
MLHSDKKKHEVEQYGKVVIAELSDLQKLENLFKGIDVIVHLAGMSSPSTSWKDVCTYSSYFANSNNKAI